MQRLVSSRKWLSILQVFTLVGLLLTLAGIVGAQEEPQAQDVTRARAFGLQHTLADEVAKTLQVLMPDVRVTADPRTNTIIAVGTEEVLSQIETWIEQLDGISKPQFFQVFTLSNRPPGEAAELLSQVLKDDPRVGTLSIVPDERANELLVRATEEEFDYIEQLLRVIDAEPSRRNAITKVFVLRNAAAEETGKLLNDVWADAARTGPDGMSQFGVAVDARTNSIIVSAQNEEVLDQVEALLIRLDEGDERMPAGAETLRIRILWIVSGDDWTGDAVQQARLAAMPDNLADVALELDSLGIGNPRIATQMVVNSSGEFGITGSAWLENPIEVEVRGTVTSPDTGRMSRPTLEISIQALEQVLRQDAPPGSVCELETTFKAPLGHFVILGVSPMNGRNSAFVVQVSGIVQ